MRILRSIRSVCNGKNQIKICADILIHRLPLYCFKCKQEILVSVKNLNE
ncbi:cysteine-rich KTR domain-containing protein [Enterococcus sp. AZ109]